MLSHYAQPFASLRHEMFAGQLLGGADIEEHGPILQPVVGGTQMRSMGGVGVVSKIKAYAKTRAEVRSAEG